MPSDRIRNWPNYNRAEESGHTTAIAFARQLMIEELMSSSLLHGQGDTTPTRKTPLSKHAIEIWRRFEGLEPDGRKAWKILQRVRSLGHNQLTAQRAASSAGHWWRGSQTYHHAVLTNVYFDALGVAQIASLQLFEPPGADPHARWCGRGRFTPPLSRSRSPPG
jgi:hypothetical protein